MAKPHQIAPPLFSPPLAAPAVVTPKKDANQLLIDTLQAYIGRTGVGLITRGETLLANAQRRAQPPDQIRARYTPFAAATEKMGLGMRYLMDGPPEVNKWLADVEAFVQKERSELIGRLFRKGLGGANIQTEIAAIGQDLAVLHEIIDEQKP